MSYGRSPYYIIGTRNGNGVDVIEFIEPRGSISRGEWPYTPTDREGVGADVVVSDDAIAQLIAHIASRGTAELQSWIDRGAALDDDYTGFHARVDKRGLNQGRTWLKTTVTVERKGKKVK